MPNSPDLPFSAAVSTVREPVPLFATLILRLDVPDAPALAADLRRVIEKRETVQESTYPFNQGGWQSTWDIDRGGGATPINLLAHACNLAKRVTMDRKGNIGAGPHPGCFTVTKHGNMWANINRSGHANEFHSHPGAYWSCVYFFDDGYRSQSRTGRRNRIHGTAWAFSTVSRRPPTVPGVTDPVAR